MQELPCDQTFAEQRGGGIPLGLPQDKAAHPPTQADPPPPPPKPPPTPPIGAMSNGYRTRIHPCDTGIWL